MAYDVLVRRGRVVDGSGNPWFRADLAIAQGKVQRLGSLGEAEAALIIDAADKFVCPGFIDTHSHSDLMLFEDPLSRPKVMQGVTTELLGQDGLGVAPIKAEDQALWRRHISGLQGEPLTRWPWLSFAEYLAALEGARLGANGAVLVSHGPVRVWAMGMAQRAPTPNELQVMAAQVREAMTAGAFGLSTGLIYAPCCYADTQELVALGRATAEGGGIIVVHVRNEAEGLLEALREMLAVGEQAGVPIHISHFKAMGLGNRGLVGPALRLLEEARQRGLEVTFDQYPYVSGSTMLSVLAPPWAHEGGADRLLARLGDTPTRQRLRQEMSPGPGLTWEHIIISSVASPEKKPLEGKTVAEIARQEGQEPPEVVLDLLREERLAVSMIRFWGAEEEVETVMKHPLGMVCTDALLLGNPHPRAYGTYPRILGHYVRERGCLSLERAIQKMTSLPAQRLGLMDRGLLRPGMWADIVIFDGQQIAERATYAQPRQYPAGIEWVLVNGEVVVRQGQHAGARPGQVLHHHR